MNCPHTWARTHVLNEGPSSLLTEMVVAKQLKEDLERGVGLGVGGVFKGSASKRARARGPPAKRLAWRVDELCESLGICASTFWKLVAAGRINTIKIGGRTLVTVAEVERLLAGGA